MAFTSVDASKRATSRGAAEPQLAFYGKTSQFRLNGPAMAALTKANGGNPVTRVTVMHDSDTGRLGIAPAADDSATAAKLSADNPNAPSRYFGFRGLAVMAGLGDDTRFILPVSYSKEDKLFIVDLSAREELPIVPRAPRCSKSEDDGGEAEPVQEAAA